MKKSGTMGYKVEIEIRDEDDGIMEEYTTYEPLMQYVKQTIRRIISGTDLLRRYAVYWVIDVATGKYIDVEI